MSLTSDFIVYNGRTHEEYTSECCTTTVSILCTVLRLLFVRHRVNEDSSTHVRHLHVVSTLARITQATERTVTKSDDIRPLFSGDSVSARKKTRHSRQQLFCVVAVKYWTRSPPTPHPHYSPLTAPAHYTVLTHTIVMKAGCFLALAATAATSSAFVPPMGPVSSTSLKRTRSVSYQL